MVEEITEKKPKRDYTVRSLERGLRILKCFDVDRPHLTFSEISELTGLHKATCFRLVKTLEDQGFLTLDDVAGRYALGSSLLRIASVVRSHEGLSRIARKHLESLAAQTGETVDLAVWTPDGVLFLDQVLTPHPFKPVSSAGRVFDDLRNAHAKILMAFGPNSRRERLLAAGADDGEEGYSPEELADRLDRVRTSGVALDLEERTAGICAVAVPVCLEDGDVVASLAVVAPRERFDPSSRESHVEALRETADAICSELG